MELPVRILFLCTGNSCRSIIAEVLANQLGEGSLRAFSAGSDPTGEVNPRAIRVLEQHGFSAAGTSSKSWDAFRDSGFDVVISVCGNAEQHCPVWLGRGIRVHWGLEDPAKVEGDPVRVDAAFQATYQALKTRIEAFAALPLMNYSHHDLKDELVSIHRNGGRVTL
jgi:arsenate reductase